MSQHTQRLPLTSLWSAGFSRHRLLEAQLAWRWNQKKFSTMENPKSEWFMKETMQWKWGNNTMLHRITLQNLYCWFETTLQLKCSVVQNKQTGGYDQVQSDKDTADYGGKASTCSVG